MLSHFSRGQLLANPVISPRSFVHGILQARYWSGLPCPSPEDIPNRGTEATSLNVSCTVRRVLYHWCPVQFSRLVVSDSLRPHESQHARPPCPSPTPGVHPNSCHPTISSSLVPFFSCPQSLPASESFPMSQLFASGGQSNGASASASVLPVNIQD